jgi:hypothetical protein
MYGPPVAPPHHSNLLLQRETDPIQASCCKYHGSAVWLRLTLSTPLSHVGASSLYGAMGFRYSHVAANGRMSPRRGRHARLLWRSSTGRITCGLDGRHRPCSRDGFWLCSSLKAPLFFFPQPEPRRGQVGGRGRGRGGGRDKQRWGGNSSDRRWHRLRAQAAQGDEGVLAAVVHAGRQENCQQARQRLQMPLRAHPHPPLLLVTRVHGQREAACDDPAALERPAAASPQSGGGPSHRACEPTRSAWACAYAEALSRERCGWRADGQEPTDEGAGEYQVDARA